MTAAEIQAEYERKAACAYLAAADLIVKRLAQLKQERDQRLAGLSTERGDRGNGSIQGGEGGEAGP